MAACNPGYLGYGREIRVVCCAVLFGDSRAELQREHLQDGGARLQNKQTHTTATKTKQNKTAATHTTWSRNSNK